MRQRRRTQVRNTLAALLAGALTLAMLTAAAAVPPRLRALIVDGQNNHDWRSTTPVMKAMLEESEMFDVDVATAGESVAEFKPAFAEYDVVLSNYNGDEWPEATKAAFEKYMSEGGGLIIVHAADNSFPNWKAYNEMIGLGGWGGRSEKDGPYVRWRDGKVVYDYAPGPGGGHGPQYPIQVVTRAPEHPIMKGLPERWMHVSEEFYIRLRGPAKNLTLLATGFADPEKGGTGENEPALFTIEYGKGRVFHTVLGHGVANMRSVGFVVTLLRGAEWAATGEVTQKFPANFPTADEAVAWYEPIQASTILDYDFGKSREPLAYIENYLRDASPKQRLASEATLLEALRAPEATYACKQFACGMLRLIGSEQSVPTLTRLLADEKLSHAARFALQGIATPKADEGLIHALGYLDGDLRIGVIGTLGARRSRDSVGALAEATGQGDEATVLAVVKALGHIGGVEAAGALDRIDAVGGLWVAKANALLQCADSMLEEGQISPALAIYRRMAREGNPAVTRIAALHGLIRADEAGAPALAVAMLRDADPMVQKAAGKFLADMPGAKAGELFAAELNPLNPETQVVVLKSLAVRGDKAAAANVVRLLEPDESVQVAAIEALAALGDASHVPLLARETLAGGAVGKAALATLALMKGASVDEAIVAQIDASADQPQMRVALIETLAARRYAEGVAKLLELATDANAGVRAEAQKGLASLAEEKDLGALIGLLLAADGEEASKGLEKAIVSVGKRMDDEAKCVEALAAANSGASPAARAAIARTLGKFGGDKALAAVTAALKDADAAVRDAAVRSLAEWPDAAAMMTALELAKSAEQETQRILALRGYIRMACLPCECPAPARAARLATALELAKRPEEQKLALEGLSQIGDFAALDLIEKYVDTEAVKAEARAAYLKAFGQLSFGSVDRADWKASASTNEGQAKAAIDGDVATRWDSGKGQEPGMWFQVDLGKEIAIPRLVLNAAASGNDFPRGYKVYLSADGKAWGDPAAEGKGSANVTSIDLAAKKARFVKIEQTGAVEGGYWSIHELEIQTPSDVEKFAHATQIAERIAEK